VSTVAAFKHFDENKFHALTDEKAEAKVRARSDAGDFELGYNGLEKSAIALCPPLADLLLLMRKQSIRAWMSGSGSACVALCHSKDDAQDLVALLQQKALVSWVHVGHFMSKHPLNIGA
jgi:4-diphosphocytidyl-2-C-methyl-D-erythritol kinase